MLVNFVDIFSISMNFKTCNPVKFDSNVETCLPLDSKKKHQLSKNTTLFRPKKGLKVNNQVAANCSPRPSKQIATLTFALSEVELEELLGRTRFEALWINR